MVTFTDRVPTYPGRVVLTPVTGQTNTYDLTRADDPVVAGTPLNAALFQAFENDYNLLMRSAYNAAVYAARSTVSGTTVYSQYANGITWTITGGNVPSGDNWRMQQVGDYFTASGVFNASSGIAVKIPLINPSGSSGGGSAYPSVDVTLTIDGVEYLVLESYSLGSSSMDSKTVNLVDFCVFPRVAEVTSMSLKIEVTTAGTSARTAMRGRTNTADIYVFPENL